MDFNNNNNKKEPSILFLDRNKLDFFTTGLQTPISLLFNENFVSSLEVVNPQELENQIKVFVEHNALPPSVITIILSFNILFEKDLADVTPANQETEVAKFIDTVPFENTTHRLLPFDRGVRVIAANKDFYDAFKTAFEKMGFTCDAVIAYEYLGSDITNISSLDAQNSPMILRKLDTLKQYTFDNETKVVKKDATATPAPKQIITTAPPKNKTRLFVMIGIFIALIIAMVVLLVLQK